MVDDNDLRLSKFYFTVIQMLRIAADWIQESMENLGRIRKDMERLYLLQAANGMASFLPTGSDSQTQDAIKIFNKNWEIVIEEQKRIGNELLARISAKKTETESLRDGVGFLFHQTFVRTFGTFPADETVLQLFNATSVSEATKARELNRYILAFTLVTIFYLPLSFLTVCVPCPISHLWCSELPDWTLFRKSLFALGLFDWQDSKQVTWSAVTVVLVAGATYLFSGLSMWVVRRPGWRPYLAEFRREFDRRRLTLSLG